jgi:6-pyruvoyltetrahydropterin/6-carboxytetrahydropterin synthase
MQKLYLYKQNFKFSSGHFLIFDEKRAERLHGHNYQVRLQIEARPEAIKSARGFLIDFKVLKDTVLSLLSELDEFVLLPRLHPDFIFREDGATLRVHFRDREYAFPKNEVKLLPILNTSVEELSSYLVERLKESWANLPVSAITVQLEETRGQAASTSLRF